jgi:RNA polymerase sigma-70 factor, ECF subfamily
MSASPIFSPDGQSKGPTLGDLLYADPTRARPSEAEWIQWISAIGARDIRALSALYQTTHRLVFTLLFRMTADRQTSWDLTLEVFQDVWQKSSEYSASTGTVLGWVMDLTRARGLGHVGTPAQRGAGACDGPEPILKMSDPEDYRRWNAALARLTPDERIAIEKAYFAPFPDTGVADTERANDFQMHISTGMTKLLESLESDGEDR